MVAESRPRCIIRIGCELLPQGLLNLKARVGQMKLPESGGVNLLHPVFDDIILGNFTHSNIPTMVS